jgi:uncharacterized protein (DUF1697 family)
MAWVVFLRGVNVGGHRTFQPSVLAKELADLDVVSVGAAGTFVIRKAVTQRALRAEFQRKLLFEAELMICSARDMINLVGGDPFGNAREEKDARRYVSVMAKPPAQAPRLPIRQPEGNEWQVIIVAITGTFALSLHRRMGRKLIYPNEVVEKKLGVAATTRNWNTIEAIASICKSC